MVFKFEEWTDLRLLTRLFARFFKEKEKSVSEPSDEVFTDSNPLKKNSTHDLSNSSSSTTSPRRHHIYNNYRNKKKLMNSLHKDESQEDSIENDSDADLIMENLKSSSALDAEEDLLFQLIKSIYEVCTEVPVE